MAQFLRPDGDQAQSGDWEAIPDDGVLWDKMDEAEANDSDYAWHDAIAAAEYFEVTLGNPAATPGSGTSTVRWRLKRIGGAKTTNMKCELRQGATAKASQTVELTDAWQALSFTTDLVTDWKSPGTTANVDAGYPDWANPNNCQSSGDSYATCSVPTAAPSLSDWLRCTNFGFGTGDIPSGATILGVEVGIEGYAATASAIKDYSLYLRKTSGQVGDNKADTDTFWASSDPDSYAVHGGAVDGWSANLADSDVRSSDFGIDFMAKNFKAFNVNTFVDHIRIRVYYRPPITDWTDLRLRFLCDSVSGGGAASDPAISWAEFKCLMQG